MSEDTLNEVKDKLWYAISYNLSSFEDHISGTEEAVKECERICLLEQINLLYNIRKQVGETLPFPAAPAWELINNEITSLNNKLNSLK